MSVDPTLQGPTPPLMERVTAALAKIRWLLITPLLVLMFFWFTGALSPTAAIVGMAIVLATALFLPRSNTPIRTAEHIDALSLQRQLQACILLTDALPDPCLLVDRRAVVVHRNQAAAAQFPSVLVGNPLAFSLRNPTLLAAIESVKSGGPAMDVEINQSVPSDVWFKVHVAPLVLVGEATGGHVAVTLQNLTEQKRIDAMRADFVANASHELRTPLTSLVGFIETLQGPAAGDKIAREKFLGIMGTQAQRMSNLIDDLLSLSRIEQRQHLRPTSRVDISLILAEVVEGLQMQAKEAGVNIHLTLPEASVEVTGDREELYEVVQNLVDNAVKYGAEGGDVAVSLKSANRSGYAHLIEVIDHGAGIAAEHVPRLTERFYRVDAESSRKKKGTGLGLAIVKHIVNRHGGQMHIRSTLGEGTRVEILLPK